MKKRTVFLSVCFVFAALSLAWAADVSGKWTAQVPGRNGQTRETTFNFKVEGDKLTGTMSGMQGGDNPISDGKISGDEISFTVKISFNGNDVTLLYKGKVSGDEIKMTRSRQGGDQPGQEFTAKRAK
ncbi:MAG TPA: hypothetical protein VFV58_35935 [Blastocatellia bacterium]|jgi:hypothetical protein|nr:hypothetical protein [Blastocatellia bacterium]